MKRMCVTMVVLGLVGCGTSEGSPADVDQACAELVACDQADPDGGVDPGPTNMPADTALLAAVSEVPSPLGELQLIDVRPAADFEAGHVPGSLSLPADSLSATQGGVPTQVLPADELAAALAAAGLSRDSGVVVYGTASDLATARMFWILQYAGFPDVRMLDGGLVAWLAAGKGVDSGPVSVTAGSLSTLGFDLQRRVEVDWVLAHLDDPDVVLIDARSAGEYSEAHIPGALNRDWQANVVEGMLLAPDQLAALYEDLPEEATLVTYCRTGMRASVAYFVLRHLGFTDVRLYDGSMAEWTADPARPLE